MRVGIRFTCFTFSQWLCIRRLCPSSVFSLCNSAGQQIETSSKFGESPALPSTTSRRLHSTCDGAECSLLDFRIWEGKATFLDCSSKRDGCWSIKSEHSKKGRKKLRRKPQKHFEADLASVATTTQRPIYRFLRGGSAIAKV
ncbi:hypothetical protein RB6693 [Rhodopirellula baltica SH 1]|uniref:Uncharacterized protein n=1 Tax=Rhodopirellula baltica (strain DSM 10527 / NCIMB 13988 / SH1) TaxID=243090 RepID=Q7UPV8_RHOBA|nr:hypothetical protein RB6693 [Rhodopirellula baltica SH 1]